MHAAFRCLIALQNIVAFSLFTFSQFSIPLDLRVSHSTAIQ
jgi:hypothetical protein